MPNAIAAEKKKFTFFVHRDVFKIYETLAEEESKKQGRRVTVPELMRVDGLKRANAMLAKRPDLRKVVGGKKTLDLDPGSNSKFASAGPASVHTVVIGKDGKIMALNKKGDVLPQWKKLDQLPEITRLFRVKRTVHEMDFDQRKTA
jgi:hypothetical protein